MRVLCTARASPLLSPAVEAGDPKSPGEDCVAFSRRPRLADGDFPDTIATGSPVRCATGEGNTSYANPHAWGHRCAAVEAGEPEGGRSRIMRKMQSDDGRMMKFMISFGCLTEIDF